MSAAVLLLSGGLDSAVTGAIAKAQESDLHALSFDYGQRHRVELHAARAVADALGVRDHRVAAIDLRVFGGSALTADIAVPKGATTPGDQIPVTYVPARNTIFLSFALAFAEVTGASRIYIGVNAIDYSGYPDCRPEYLRAFEKVAKLGTRAGVEGKDVEIAAPLLHMTKAEIIRKGAELGVPFQLTHSCYSPAADGAPCGECDSCRIRRRGFAEAGIADPLASPKR